MTDPIGSDAPGMRAEALRRSGRAPEALLAFQLCLNSGRSPWLLERRAETLLDLDRPREALDDLQEALAGRSRPSTHALRGHAYKSLRAWRRAGEDFDQVWRRAPLREAYELCRWKGGSGWSPRTAPDAPKLRRVLRSLNSGLTRPDGQAFWLRLWRGELLALLEHSPEAARDLRRAATLRPRHPWAWMLLAEANWEGNRTVGVLRALERARRLQSALPARHLALLGESRFMTGDARGAFDAFNLSVKAAPSEERPMYHCWRGQARLWAGRYGQAIQDFDEALRLDPHFFWAAAWTGGAYCMLGRPEEALPCLQRGLAGDPKDNEGHVWMGEALRLLGRLDEAEVFLRRPSREDTWTWSLVNLALSRCRRADLPGARRLLRSIRAQRGMRRFLDSAAVALGLKKIHDTASIERLLQATLRANLGNRAHPPSPLHFEGLRALRTV